MATTFIKIQTITVGSGGASSIDFTSIPATYTDLQLVFTTRCTTAALTVSTLMRLNNDTSANYSWKEFFQNPVDGYGSTGNLSASSVNAGMGVGATATASTFSNSSAYIPQYTDSAAKSVLVESSASNNTQNSDGGLYAGYWTGTAAINQVTLFPTTGNFVQYSTATLYGIG